MSVSEEQLEALKQKISEVFADVSYPKGVIAPHECDECREVRKTFANKDWKTIKPAIVEENHGNLPLFSAEAFHYFLPAFIVYSLDNFNDNFVCQFTIYALSPDKENIKNRLEYWQNRFEHFTAEQINLIYEFLNLVKAKEDDHFYQYHKQVETGKKHLKEFIEPILKNI